MIHFLFSGLMMTALISTTAFASPPELKVQVNFGEKSSRFEISSTATGGQVDLLSNQAPKQSRPISKDDLDYLKSSFKKVPGPSNSIEFCPRSHVIIAAKGKKMIGCLGAANLTARQLQKIADLLSMLF